MISAMLALRRRRSSEAPRTRKIANEGRDGCIVIAWEGEGAAAGGVSGLLGTGKTGRQAKGRAAAGVSGVFDDDEANYGFYDGYHHRKGQKIGRGGSASSSSRKVGVMEGDMDDEYSGDDGNGNVTAVRYRPVGRETIVRTDVASDDDGEQEARGGQGSVLRRNASHAQENDTSSSGSDSDDDENGGGIVRSSSTGSGSGRNYMHTRRYSAPPEFSGQRQEDHEHHQEPVNVNQARNSGSGNGGEGGRRGWGGRRRSSTMPTDDDNSSHQPQHHSNGHSHRGFPLPILHSLSVPLSRHIQTSSHNENSSSQNENSGGLGLGFGGALRQDVNNNSKLKVKPKPAKAYLQSDVIYTCASCRAHLCTHEDLVSKCFQGRGGRAYLFQTCVNVAHGPAEDRLLITGLHSVRDISCLFCTTVLGWTYDEAFEASQKYKEGKFILETANVFVMHGDGDCDGHSHYGRGGGAAGGWSDGGDMGW